MRTYLVTSAAICLAALSACGNDTPATGPERTETPSNEETPQSVEVPSTTEEAAEAPREVSLSVAPGELRAFINATGSARPMPFGTGREQVARALKSALGEPTMSTDNPECPSGPLSVEAYPDDLTVYYSEGKLAGWFAGRNSSLTTMTGVGPGGTLADFQRDFATADLEKTTLGWEAMGDDFSATFTGNSPDATLTAMWSGEACIFR